MAIVPSFWYWVVDDGMVRFVRRHVWLIDLLFWLTREQSFRGLNTSTGLISITPYRNEIIGLTCS